MASTQPGEETPGTGSQALDVLLARVEDAALRAELAAEIAPLRAEQSLGLVFERHLPETARLYGHPVRRGLSVQHRAEAGGPTWQVVRVAGGQATLRRSVDGEAVEDTCPVSDLVVVREFGTPIYPGLRSEGRVARGGDAPWHTVINAENFHALETLLYTCAGQVDAIYIDPPYNTGNEFVYNDKRVSADDGYRHSKWLSFMEKRLLLARKLLKETGVIFISIDDNEQAHLKLLCDQIFGEQNFIATAAWQSFDTVKNNAKVVSKNCEYVVAYAKDARSVVFPGVRKGEKQRDTYKNPDDDPRGPYLRTPLHVVASTSVNRRASRTFSNGQTWQPPAGRAWAFSVDALAALDADGRLDLDPAGKKAPQRKTYWSETKDRMPLGTFWKYEDFGSTRNSNQEVGDLLGKGAFSFPKPTKLLARLLDATTAPDALVLDFFAGSGTTAHAVMRLNAADGGRRRSIVVTNNEVSQTVEQKLRKAGHLPGDPEWEAEGVFRKVTKPRLEAAATGLRPDGSEHKQGTLDANVEFFTLTYEDPDTVKLGAAFAAVAPLLWLKAGAQGPRIDQLDPAGWVLPDGGRYGVLSDTDQWAGFTAAVNAAAEAGHPPVAAFIITGSETVFQQIASELPPETEPVRLYDDYLTAFTINTGRTP